MYKLVKNELTNQVNSVLRLSDNTNIPMVYANTDYRNFKKEINEETAELQDAEGDTMTAAEAKEFVATLP
jgi:phosphoenolpyruvate-protein kinase (PTS system EI component)